LHGAAQAFTYIARERDRLGVAGYLNGLAGGVHDDATVFAVFQVAGEALQHRGVQLAVEILG